MNLQSLDSVRRLAAETLNVPQSVLRVASTFQEAGIDSLATMDLVFAVETFYGITIAPEDLASMHSLRDLALCVDRLTAQEARLHGE